MRIGLITDSHQPSERDGLWDEIYTAFAGVDLILHAGDIQHPMVLDWLEEIAPVIAARGNNDFDWDDHRVQDVQWLDVEGQRIAMTHIIEPEDRPIDVLRAYFFDDEHMDIMISGHTHFERIDYREGCLQINTGSPTQPHLWSTRLGTVGLLEITRDDVQARIIRLGDTPGRRNPGVEYVYTRAGGVIQHPPPPGPFAPPR